MFATLLIANRGEIACRVIRTARRMGLRTVAVYSEADAHALHVASADEAYCVGPAPAKESYLRGDAILAVARQCGAQAIHPGYGFLSENDTFAEACEKAGIVFVGPPAAAIRAMGSKSAAKTIMQKAKVPLVPGYHGDKQDPATLQKEADKVGYPLLVKASAGGGGKGMRIVEQSSDFAGALASCKREAASAFGDDKVLLERYLRRPRHIEIQVFADRHGHCVHLFERDCSVQRRHQKVLEEAPAPGLTAERRAEMGAAAVAAAKAIGYVGAGTVEFIADPSGTFHFMEMNTRLQVEHPVTEMITGQDLVEWQIRVAAGEPLPVAQDGLAFEGHALEARIYAEDPDRDFLPATGTIAHMAAPATSRYVRVDTGVRTGDAISPHYDPMIAKLIVWGPDRAGALARMRSALGEFEVVGLTTNIGFLARLVASEAFAGADLDTGLIERNRAMLFPPAQAASDEVLALATLDELLRLESAAREHAATAGDPYSPWGARDGWRANEDNHHDFLFREGERRFAVTVHYRGDAFELELPHGRRTVSGERFGETLRAWLDDRTVAARVVRSGRTIDIFQGAEHHTLELHDPGLHELEASGADGGLAAPMPGKIIAVLVEAGATVEKGTPLLILEAMKMEHTIKAPAGGTVKELLYGVGEQVEEGAELLAFERSKR
ncbi:MAG: acetyl/propionyl/methylcrotonyl-CoA carboxylase subunit alpha [Betaproteobacteria bacterium]|jgi:3-methylcrotonyl-CoA carboxylase alpha subunit|nr:acetyl/propionyl/methylcrotonyl-CoA carboxylase subunit alpha [Betaproteobacteria bacterium]